MIDVFFFHSFPYICEKVLNEVNNELTCCLSLCLSHSLIRSFAKFPKMFLRRTASDSVLIRLSVNIYYLTIKIQTS